MCLVNGLPERLVFKVAQKKFNCLEIPTVHLRAHLRFGIYSSTIFCSSTPQDIARFCFLLKSWSS